MEVGGRWDARKKRFSGTDQAARSSEPFVGASYVTLGYFTLTDSSRDTPFISLLDGGVDVLMARVLWEDCRATRAGLEESRRAYARCVFVKSRG